MTDEVAMASLVQWCRDQKRSCEESLAAMKDGRLKVFHGAAHDEAHDVTQQEIERNERIIIEMQAIIDADTRRTGA